MPDGGTLTLSTQDSGDEVMMTVADTGTGMAEDVRSRIFDPFFTTKPVGAGLGLGLAISEGVTRDFGGVLRARNRPEGGAEFTIELPAAVHAREAAHA
jgi:two-component system C4-dicarboxylate transport sensor histidine kinase DctB